MFLMIEAPVQSAETAQNSVLKAQIKSDTLGNATAFIKKDALRINIGDGRARLVARAPDWKVYLYNGVNNCGLEMPLDKWIAHHPSWTYIGNDDWLFGESLLKVVDVKRLGIEATRYKLATKLGSGEIVSKHAGTHGHLIMGKVDNLAPQAASIIRRTFGIPAAGGFPLELVTYAKEQPVKIEAFNRKIGGDSHLFMVSSLSKDTRPDSFFEKPKGFVPKAREVEVIFDSERTKSVENVMDMLK